MEKISIEDNIRLKRQTAIIVFFIYVSVFINSYVLIKEPFEFYIGYLIFVLLLPVFISRYGVDRNLVGIFFVLFFTGLFNVFIGNNTYSLFFKVFVGLMMSYFFYDGVIKEFDFNIEKLFYWYMKGSFVVSVIGLIQFISFQVGFTLGYDFHWILNKWGVAPGGLFGIRINSVLAEPSYMAGVLSPAFFVAVYNLTRKSPYLISRIQGGVIMAVYILSFSALGQAGIFLSVVLIMINFGLIRYFLIMAVLAALLFNVLYENVADFRERYDSLVELFTMGRDSFKLGKTHGSSFILYNNFIVTTENFKTNFLFGGGIGSHPIAFEKFNLAKDIGTAGFSNNSADANSMLLRLVSETGLFGTFVFLLVVFKCYVSRDFNRESNHWIISNAILVIILLNLFRQGHYFLNGFPFFVLMYYYNYIDYKRSKDKGMPVTEEFESKNDLDSVA